jgi:4-amino-4-deoxy-L-arabinose transferase-like glycosyltransferase
MSSTTDGPQHLNNRLFSFREPQVVVNPEPAVGVTGKKNRAWINIRTGIYALVFLGIILRVIPMIQNRCLWIDEAMLALNLVDRTPRQLLEPLDWNQGAPIGFLLSVKAAISVFGASEWALRLFPFLGSLIGFLAFTWLSRRLLPEQAALLAVALFAISPSLISYTAECKQYVTDASLAVVIFCVSLALLHREEGTRRWAILGMVGTFAVWFSHPAVFVLGAVGTALFLDCLAMRERRRVLACLATIGCWLASFGVCYITSLRHLGTNQYLLDYWAGHFLLLPPTSVGDLAWLISHFSNFIDFPGGLGGSEVKASGLAAAFFLIGWSLILRERWPVAFALIAPAFFALIASGFHKYPFAGRLLLFLVPLLLLGVARGAWAVAVALKSTLPFASFVVLGLLILAPAVESYQQIQRPLRYEQITSVLDDVRQKWQPGDKVYLYYGAIPAYTFYTADRPFVPDVVKGTEFRGQRTGYRDELRKLAGNPRVWLIFSHRHAAEESLLKAYAEGLGECREEVHRPGATAFLFDFSTTR